MANMFLKKRVVFVKEVFKFGVRSYKKTQE